MLLQPLIWCISWVYLLTRRQIVVLNSGSSSRSINLLYPSNFAFHSSYSCGRGSSPSPNSRWGSTAGDVPRPTDTNLVREASDVFSNVDPESSSSSTELWLDLRGTAISPRVALHHLLKEPAASNDAAVEEVRLNLNTHKMKLNRVLVSHLNEEEFKKQSLTNVQMKPVQDMISDGFLVALDDTEENTTGTDYSSLIEIVPTSYASQKYAGELITLKDAVNLVHPIPAMICLERGGWVVLDPRKIAEETDRRDSVTHIVNLLSGSLPSSFQLTTASKCESSWIISGESNNLGGRTSDGSGGIAIVCSSNQDVFNFAHLIESLRSQNDSSVTVRKSGILTVSSSQKYQPRADEKVTTRLATALVLPFDLVLWETLSLFIQQS